MKEEIFQLEMLQYLIDSDLREVFPNVDILLIFLKSPVGIAAAERSFSKLKVIKNYRQASTSQQRLNSFAVLSTEYQRAKLLDVDKLVGTFLTWRKT